MGGKVWSDDEERIFWDLIIPQSPNAANPADRGKLSWKECAVLMQQTLGDGARRDYTHTMLYEHHYQNFKPGPKTPRAGKFMKKYLSDWEWYEVLKHTSPPPSPSTPAAAAPTLANPATQFAATGAPAKVAIPRQMPLRQGATAPDRPSFYPASGPKHATSFSIPNSEQMPPNYPPAAQYAPPTLTTNTPPPSYWNAQSSMRRQHEAVMATGREILRPSTRNGPLAIDPALRGGVVINHIMSASEQESEGPIPVLQYFVSSTGETRSSPQSRASTRSTSDSLASECTRTTPIDSRSPADSSIAYGHTRATDRDRPLSAAARYYASSGRDFPSIHGKRKRSETGTPEGEHHWTRPSPFMTGGRSLLNDDSEAATTLQHLNRASYHHPTQQSPRYEAKVDADAQDEHRGASVDNES
ncbi:Fc.00g050250.m01.CDS01 [Cosmosporella sp. VM-42]